MAVPFVQKSQSFGGSGLFAKMQDFLAERRRQTNNPVDGDIYDLGSGTLFYHEGEPPPRFAELESDPRAVDD